MSARYQPATNAGKPITSYRLPAENMNVEIAMLSTKANQSYDIEAMDRESLSRFVRLASDHTQAFALRLFPSKPAGYLDATNTLAMIAWWRYREITAEDESQAVECRAMWRYGIASLPLYARWK